MLCCKIQALSSARALRLLDPTGHVIVCFSLDEVSDTVIYALTACIQLYPLQHIYTHELTTFWSQV